MIIDVELTDTLKLFKTLLILPFMSWFVYFCMHFQFPKMGWKKKQETFFSCRSNTMEQSSPAYVFRLIKSKNCSNVTKLLSNGLGCKAAVIPRLFASLSLLSWLKFALSSAAKLPAPSTSSTTCSCSSAYCSMPSSAGLTVLTCWISSFDRKGMERNFLAATISGGSAAGSTPPQSSKSSGVGS